MTTNVCGSGGQLGGPFWLKAQGRGAKFPVTVNFHTLRVPIACRPAPVFWREAFSVNEPYAAEYPWAKVALPNCDSASASA